MDGIELYNNAKKLYPKMSVIFFSGTANINSDAIGLKEGVSYYFGKPVDFKLLNELLNTF